MEKLLYECDGIKIYEENIPDEHKVQVGTHFCHLPSGILKQLSQTDPKGLEQGLETVNPLFLNRLREQGISLEDLDWAISKARMVELDREVQYFVREYNELKAKID